MNSFHQSLDKVKSRIVGWSKDKDGLLDDDLLAPSDKIIKNIDLIIDIIAINANAKWHFRGVALDGDGGISFEFYESKTLSFTFRVDSECDIECVEVDIDSRAVNRWKLT